MPSRSNRPGESTSAKMSYFYNADGTLDYKTDPVYVLEGAELSTGIEQAQANGWLTIQTFSVCP